MNAPQGAVWKARRRALVVMVLACAAVGLGLTPAGAVSSLPTVPGTSYQANGRVTDILSVGNVIYIAGQFTSVRPSGAAAGTGEVARNRLAAFNRDTGAVLAWNPNADKDVIALAASADGATIYVGGLFAKVGGASHKRVAAVNATSGVPTSWNPSLDGKVYALAVSASRVYLGGTFTTVNGQARTRLAAVSTSGTGTLDSTWKPAPDGAVRALSMSVDGGSVFAGGEFLTVNGDTYGKHLVNLDPATGAMKTWNWRPGFDIWAITVTADRVYLAGNGAGGHVSAHSLPGGSRLWQVQTDGGMQAIALLNGVVYAGGHQDYFCAGNTISGGTNGFECDVIQATRHKLIALDPVTGALDPWNPGANSNLGVFALSVSGGKLLVGGDFTTIGGKTQNHYAQFG